MLMNVAQVPGLPDVFLTDTRIVYGYVLFHRNRCVYRILDLDSLRPCDFLKKVCPLQ